MACGCRGEVETVERAARRRALVRTRAACCAVCPYSRGAHRELCLGGTRPTYVTVRISDDAAGGGVRPKRPDAGLGRLAGCPRGRFPDASGHVAWGPFTRERGSWGGVLMPRWAWAGRLGLDRWVGVPYPVRAWLYWTRPSHPAVGHHPGLWGWAVKACVWADVWLKIPWHFGWGPLPQPRKPDHWSGCGCNVAGLRAVWWAQQRTRRMKAWVRDAVRGLEVGLRSRRGRRPRLSSSR